MRLLNIKTLEFEEFLGSHNRPKYAIASHRWVGGFETTYQDFRAKRNTDGLGYQKIISFIKYIEDNLPSLEWIWADTCCINKESDAELSKAVNLMFEWYRNAEICLAYLPDVKNINDLGAFRRSEWFTRGWTLQELLAPRTVVFLSVTWQVIGNKGGQPQSFDLAIGPSLEQEIAQATAIPEQALCDYDSSSSLSVEERLKWMDGRTTTLEEDMSYALYGIFNVSPGANYGERGSGARQRLLAAIHQQDNIAIQRAESLKKITDWLSPPDPWTNHNFAYAKREAETGLWLLHSDGYHSWKSGRLQHVWLHGKPGCGKSVLCATVIEDLRVQHRTKPDIGIASFYFSFTDDNKQQYGSLLRSLVAQLGWKEPALSKLRQAYESHRQGNLRVDELEDILCTAIRAHETVYLVLDALDESPEGGEIRETLLDRLQWLAARTSNLRVFATSRDLKDIREAMVVVKADPFAVDSSAVDVDIRRYVSSEIARDRTLRRLDARIRTEIEESIAHKGDGMFRWAYCQLQELKKLKDFRPSYVRKALYQLPETLDETYSRMLTDIGAMYRKDALTLLRWLAYARSPPTLGQLVDTVIIDLEKDDVNVDDRGSIDGVLNILSGLVSVIEERTQDEAETTQTPSGLEHDINLDGGILQAFKSDNQVRLAHFSVKEYLESSRILESDAKDFWLEHATGHQFLAQSCLVYLMHYSNWSEKSLTRQDLNRFPLILYAARSWYRHSALSPKDHWAVDREELLLKSESARRHWICIHDPLFDDPSVDHVNDFREPIRVPSDLFYASLLGLPEVAARLLESGAKANAHPNLLYYPLQAAAHEGHHKLVSLLIKHGADVNLEAGFHGTALQAASAANHKPIVKLLLDNGAVVHVSSGHYGTAIQAAAVKGNVECMQLLLKHGAEVNLQGGHFDTALQAAAVNDHRACVSLLLKNGANVNLHGGCYGTALQAASAFDYQDCVSLLLDNGADVNIQSGRHGSALQAAVAGGHDECLSLLLRNGADVNIRNEHDCAALQTAALHGYDECVSILLDSGVDVNEKSGWHGTALQAAAALGHRKCIELLLAKGADVNIQGGRYGSALQAAAIHGCDECVSLLLENGADNQSEHGYHWSVLKAASERARLGVVSPARDVDVPARNADEVIQSEFSVTCARAHATSLLREGANIEITKSQRDTLLQVAELHGHSKMVRLFLDGGLTDTAPSL